MTKEEIKDSILRSIIVAAGIIFLAIYFAKSYSYPVSFEAGPNRVVRLQKSGWRNQGFILAVLEPKYAKSGDIQKIFVGIEDPDGIAKIFAETKLDTKFSKLPLRLKLGNNQSGYWMSAWVLHDITLKTYETTIVSKNLKGKTTEIILPWIGTN